MKLRVIIQGTDKRARWISVLAELLRQEESFTDQVRVSWDQTGVLWEGAKQALTFYDPTDTHIMILQDDVLPCKEIIPFAEQLIEDYPTETISLFTNKRSTAAMAKLKHKSWIRLKVWLMAQCFIMPISRVEQMLPWLEIHAKPSIYFDDNRYAMFHYYHELPVYASVYSLVEHLGWNSTTLRQYGDELFQRPDLRMAANFIGFENNPYNLTWDDLYNAEPDSDGAVNPFQQDYI